MPIAVTVKYTEPPAITEELAAGWVVMLGDWMASIAILDKVPFEKYQNRLFCPSTTDTVEETGSV
jgi:hypothetical protein